MKKVMDGERRMDMWSRKELKEKAKAAFKVNYWKSVFVALIFTLLVGGVGGFSIPNSSNYFNQDSFSNHSIIDTTDMTDEEREALENGGSVTFESDGETFTVTANTDGFTVENEDSAYTTDFGEAETEAVVAATIVLAMVVFFIILVAFAFGIVIDVFIINPVELGCAKFFVKNSEEPAAVKHVLYAFDHGYKNIAKALFFRDLYIVLWSLLFVIPGIIKSYEYRMIPYILADNPELSQEAAFELSKKMMMGNKWNAFVLDLSFIGWDILSALTCGILGIFYVDPYIYATNAELYLALKNTVDGEITDSRVVEVENA